MRNKEVLVIAALPTVEDDQTLNAILLNGVPEVVLKMGEKSCYFAHAGELGFVPVQAVQVVDTTSAGDSFNAGYMSQRLSGASVEESCSARHRLVSTVGRHRGAIILLEEMP